MKGSQEVRALTWVFAVCIGIVRASSLFPILSTILLLLGGVCVAVGRAYSGRNNILLSAGILFVAAGKDWVCGGFVSETSPKSALFLDK